VSRRRGLAGAVQGGDRPLCWPAASKPSVNQRSSSRLCPGCVQATSLVFGASLVFGVLSLVYHW